MEYNITDIKPISASRKLIYIDYEPAFALYAADLKKYNICEDSLLSDKTYDELTQVLSKRAISRAMNLLKNKDYTRAELIKKLDSSYYVKAAVDSAVEYVESFGYIDDYRYAQNYIAFKAASKSRKQIVYFLRQKGISNDIIEECCSSYYEENTDTELNSLIKSLNKKLMSYDKKPSYEELQKLTGYYYRKGFSAGTIKKALDIVLYDRYNN